MRQFSFFALAGFATSIFATSAMAAPQTAMQAAPDPTIHLNAPKDTGRCGVFETCANTKIGLGKGDFIIRLSGIGVITNNTSSGINVYPPGQRKSMGGTGISGGHLSAGNAVAPEFTFEYFLNDHFSIDAIAASAQISARAHNVKALNGAGSKVGSFWILPPTITLAYHFLPHQRFNPYLGVGLTVAFFHNTSTNNAALFNNPHLKVTPGPSFNLGFDYQLVGNWFANVDVKQMLLHVPIRINGGSALPGYRIHAHDSVNPTIVGAGIGYRF